MSHPTLCSRGKRVVSLLSGSHPCLWPPEPNPTRFRPPPYTTNTTHSCDPDNGTSISQLLLQLLVSLPFLEGHRKLRTSQLAP